MSLHLPHPHRPHIDPETLELLALLGAAALLMLCAAGLGYWITAMMGPLR